MGLLCGVETAAAEISAAQTDKETLITAQHMASDQNTGVVTATGKVEIARNGYILHADKVTYNQTTDVMRAEGHVVMLTPSGEVEFADAEEITGDMKQAFVQNLGILFPDNSRMTARIAQRYDGRYLVADRGTYTACNVCKEDPNTPPLWQVQARQVVHDNVEHNIYYHDATVEFAGVPLIYTPYMSTPDPTVDRRQGFLTPTPGITPTLGPYVKVPYYFDISPDADATIAPTFSREDQVQFGGTVRKRFAEGSLAAVGSFTHADLISDTGIDEGKQWRGHLFAHALTDIDNVWRAGSDVQFTSDKSYLQRYHYSSTDTLTNRAYLEGFKGRDYAVVNSYYFQDLRAGTQAVQPFVLPQANFSALGEPGKTWGGRWSVGGDMLTTARDNSGEVPAQQGPSTRRLALNTGWERQFMSDTGLVTNLSGLARAHSYWADNVVNPDGSGDHFNTVLFTRTFEQANSTVRYPMGRSGDGYQQVLEPLVALTAAPTVHVSAKQPIEDSVGVQFDETNLFTPNRFTGYDLIEGGSRATYGLRHAITGDNGARVEMFGGQSYSFASNDAFPTESGLRSQTSDYVGRIDVRPNEWISGNYGFRLDHTTLTPQRQDALLSVGAPIFRPQVRYLSGYVTDTLGKVVNNEEINFGFSSSFAKYWQVTGAHTQAFSPQPGPRTSSVGVSYTDECYIFSLGVSHDNTNRIDIQSGTSVMFHMFLRNVGGLHTDSFTPTESSFPTQFRQY